MPNTKIYNNWYLFPQDLTNYNPEISDTVWWLRENLREFLTLISVSSLFALSVYESCLKISWHRAEFDCHLTRNPQPGPPAKLLLCSWPSETERDNRCLFLQVTKFWDYLLCSNRYIICYVAIDNNKNGK